MLRQPAISMLNHLLAQSGWALPRLARLAGKTVRLNLPLFTLVCTIQDDGSLLAATPDTSSDAVCTIPAALLPRLALLDESALEQVERFGDAALTEEIFFLARNLRWDVAEDLSRVTGDIAAERIVEFAGNAQRQVRQNALNLSHALAEYWTEERPLIATRRQIESFAQGAAKLQSAIASLEQRINRLSKAG